MSEFVRILDRFQDHERNLKELGNEVVKRYPQSSLLVELTDELHAALEGLGMLRLKLGDAIDQAEQEMALKSNLLMQMADSQNYSQLSNSEKDHLTEYLLSQERGLASDQELLDFSLESLTQAPEEDLLSAISKEDVISIGRIAYPGADDFSAYDAGLSMVRESLSDPVKHDEIVLEIAKGDLKKDPAELIRLFYSGAFGKQPGEEAPLPPVEMPEGEVPPLAPETPAEPINTLPEDVEPEMEEAPPVEEEKSEEEVLNPEEMEEEPETEDESEEEVV